MTMEITLHRAKGETKINVKNGKSKRGQGVKKQTKWSIVEGCQLPTELIIITTQRANNDKVTRHVPYLSLWCLCTEYWPQLLKFSHLEG